MDRYRGAVGKVCHETRSDASAHRLIALARFPSFRFSWCHPSFQDVLCPTFSTLPTPCQSRRLAIDLYLDADDRAPCDGRSSDTFCHCLSKKFFSALPALPPSSKLKLGNPTVNKKISEKDLEHIPADSKWRHLNALRWGHQQC